MYDEAVLAGLTARLIERQDEPTSLLEDLYAVRSQQESQDLPREFQRFELKLEIDRDDMDFVIGLVEDEVGDTDVQNQ